MDQEAFDQAVTDIEDWLDEHCKALNGEQFAQGASEDQIAQVELIVGVFPRELKELYLRHNGQRPRRIPLTPWGYFADLEFAMRDLPHMLTCYFNFDGKISPDSLREPLDLAQRTRLKDEEIKLRNEELTLEWWPLVVGNGEYIAVHLRTGRMFEWIKDVPSVTFVADSLTRWLNDYASQLWDDEIVIDEHGGLQAT